METKIRSAKRGDAAFIAWLILAAGRAHVQRGIWEVILNEPEERCLNFFEHLSTTSDPHPFHYSCFLLAEAAGRPAAGMGGYDPAILGYQALSCAMPEAFRKSGLRPGENLSMRETPRIVQCVPPPLEGAW
ncbi:MAG: hypothetical protein C4576_10750, partial [Desulfobacteraceae bacterium]